MKRTTVLIGLVFLLLAQDSHAQYGRLFTICECRWSEYERVACTDTIWTRNTQNESLEITGYIEDEEFFFSYRYITIIQSGQAEVTPNEGAIDEYTAYMNCPGIEGCSETLLPGLRFKFTISDFPEWFDFYDPFTIAWQDPSLFCIDPPLYRIFPSIERPTSTTTTTTPQSDCAAEQVYGERAEETEALREYRDNVLSKTEKGRALIKLYYNLSPMIAERMREDPKYKAQVKSVLDTVVDALDANPQY